MFVLVMNQLFIWAILSMALCSTPIFFSMNSKFAALPFVNFVGFSSSSTPREAIKW